MVSSGVTRWHMAHHSTGGLFCRSWTCFFVPISWWIGFDMVSLAFNSVVYIVGWSLPAIQFSCLNMQISWEYQVTLLKETVADSYHW